MLVGGKQILTSVLRSEESSGHEKLRLIIIKALLSPPGLRLIDRV